MFQIIKVRGQSMAPTFQDGDYILARRITKPNYKFKIGNIYLIDHIDLGLIIKRLDQETADGRLIVSGDNPVSNSGDILGHIDKTRVRARALLKISSKGTRRL